MENREEIAARLEKSHRMITTRLEKAEKQREIYPLWNVREVLAHLSGWDDAVIGFINSTLKGETPATPAIEGIDAYNKKSVAARKGLSYEQIFREYTETRAKLLALIRRMPQEMVGQKTVLPWGGEGSLEDIADIFERHDIEHAEDLERILEGNQ